MITLITLAHEIYTKNVKLGNNLREFMRWEDIGHILSQGEMHRKYLIMHTWKRKTINMEYLIKMALSYGVMSTRHQKNISMENNNAFCETGTVRGHPLVYTVANKQVLSRKIYLFQAIVIKWIEIKIKQYLFGTAATIFLFMLATLLRRLSWYWQVCFYLELPYGKWWSNGSDVCLVAASQGFQS